MDAFDSTTDTPTEVVVRCQDSDSVVRFCDRRRLDSDSVRYAVEASAPGLSARVDEAVEAVWGPDLAGFLDELAWDFRGWPGRRTWHSLEHDPALSAVS